MEKDKVYILLDQFNNTIDQWIVWLDGYSLDMLCQKPLPQSWSLGQVYVHIIADTKYFVEQMKTSSLTKANGEKTMHKDAQWIFDHYGFPNIYWRALQQTLIYRNPIAKMSYCKRLRR